MKVRCDGCNAIKNNITNGFPMNIYLDESNFYKLFFFCGGGGIKYSKI